MGFYFLDEIGDKFLVIGFGEGFRGVRGLGFGRVFDSLVEGVRLVGIFGFWWVRLGYFRCFVVLFSWFLSGSSSV